MARRSFRSAAALALLFLNISVPVAAWAHDAGTSETPARASKPEGFAPEAWQVDSLATGDLNKDGLPDAALIVSFEGGPNGVDQRRLIVALKKREGGYEKAVESDKAVVLACGPSGGIPSVEIKKNVLVVQHYCGSRTRYAYTHKYQLRNGQWILIGYTANSQDTIDPDKDQTIDVNTMTGELSSSWLNNHKTVRERILELWAAPISSDEPSPSDWGAPAVRLTNASSKSGCAATLQAVHSKKKLFVKAQLDGDKHPTAGDVCLVDANGHVIPSESSRATVYGYIVNTYDLSAQPFRDLISKQGSNGNQEPILRLSVDVKSYQGGAQKLSTKCKSQPGAIFLSKNKGAPELKDVDLRDGDPVHPFLHYEAL